MIRTIAKAIILTVGTALPGAADFGGMFPASEGRVPFRFRWCHLKYGSERRGVEAPAPPPIRNVEPITEAAMQKSACHFINVILMNNIE